MVLGSLVGDLVTIVPYAYGPEEEQQLGKSKLKCRAEILDCVCTIVYDVCWNSYSEIFSLRVVVLVAVSVNDSGKCVALTETAAGEFCAL